MSTSSYTVRRLGPADIPHLRKLNALSGEAFGDGGTYGRAPPTDAYLQGLLSKEHVVAVAALAGEEIVGGLVAYEIDKWKRARREFYIHDLAVAAGHRRPSIATGLIEHLRGTCVIYGQADHGDGSAIALYGELDVPAEVLSFDIGGKAAKSAMMGRPLSR